MASFTYAQAPDLPDSSEFDYEFLSSDVAEMCTSSLDHLARPEDSALIDNFAGNEPNPWDEFEDLTCSLAQGNLLDFDTSRIQSNADSASLNPFYDTFTLNIDLLSKLQTDNFSLDPLPEPPAAEWSNSMEKHLTDVPSSILIPITPGSGYQPTPDLTGCSTPASPLTSNSSRASITASIDGFDTENQRWHATLSRSRTADRYFLYGVLTTKIFCRPSCASRRPSRRHVRFFPFPGAIEAAEQAKFRPCKRCKPETLGTGNTGVLAITQVLRKIIAETLGERSKGEKEELKLESLAKSAGLSTFHFHRLFKATTQVTPADFITACHAIALQDDLRAYSAQGSRSNQCAVQLPPRWSQRAARKALGGLNPEEYANGAKSASSGHCRVRSPVGDLEVTYSENKKTSSLAVHAMVLLHDSSPPIGDHFGIIKGSEKYARRLQQCVRELEEKCQDRDTELAADVLSVLWRARLWLKVTHENELR